MEDSGHEGGRGLRRNAVGLPGLVAQSLGVTAPEISAVVIAAVVATKVGAFTPLAFLVAGIGAIGLALIYGRFARYVPSARRHVLDRAHRPRPRRRLPLGLDRARGRRRLRARPAHRGRVPAAELLRPRRAASPVLLHELVGLGARSSAGALIVVSYLGIQISARVLLTLTAIGVTMLLVLDIVILAKGGLNGWAWASISPWSTHGFGLGFFALGVGIAMTGFSGFETAVFLAEEAHTPKREVPKAVLGAVVLAIVFFIVTTFAIVSGYGMAKAGTQWPQDSGGAVVGLSAQYMALWFGKLLLLLLAISSFASALGTANFTTRLAFSWGHDGYLPRAFGHTHPRFKSPDVAIGALAIVTARVFIAGLAWQGRTVNDAVTFFSWLLQVGATGILPVYAAVGIAGAVFASRTGGSAVDRYLAPALAVIVTGAAEVTEFYGQQGIFRWAPYVMLGWIALGVVVRLATRNQVADVERRAEAAQPELTPAL